MPFKILHYHSSSSPRIRYPNILRPFSPPSFPFTHQSLSSPAISFPSSSSPLPLHFSSQIRRRFAVPHEASSLEIESEIGVEVQENEQLSGTGGEELGSQGLSSQMKEIVTFTGPAIGLWICGPLMSLIDTAVIGQGSAVELAALGPATVLCDYTSYVFMFLSIATSNMVATALAKQDKNEVQHHISVLLFIGLMSGFLMLLLTKLLGPVALTDRWNCVVS